MKTTACVGIDVSARTLVVASEEYDVPLPGREFANDADGHQALGRWLTARGRTARVCLEATGIYSLDVAVRLAATPGVAVMVVNPRAARDFARARLQRAKTDRTDASVLREFARRMPWVAWTPPSAPTLALRGVARRIAGLVVARTQERARLHAATASDALSALVQRDIQQHLRELERRIATLRRDAQALITAEPTLAGPFRHLVSVRGIAAASAIQLLGELALLPPDMTARQWVAHAGLDPRPYASGTSVHRAPRISKVGNTHLRRALYMPALVASRRDPHVRAFATKLRQRGKTPLQSIVAVMRKLLHAIHAMLRTDQDFDPTKFHAVA